MQAADAFVVRTASDLYRLKRAEGLSSVVVDTKRLKFRNLVPHGLKYATWALRPGGTLLVRDNGANVYDLWPRFVSFKLMRQWTFKLLAADTELVRLDTVAGEIELVRRRPPTPPGWSAGVVFSGRAEEVPQLRRCLDSLLLQPELRGESGGEIVVSGPEAARSCVAGYNGVDYHGFEMPPGPRVMICAKKNDLIRRLRSPRLAIMHTRITLAPDTLRHAPTEFELLTPRVLSRGPAGWEDYLSLGVHDSALPGYAPRLTPSSMRRSAVDNYLELYDHGTPYLDGGVFFVRKDVHERCPLNDDIAWDEVEDLEWSTRAIAAGFLIDIAPEVIAYSAVAKLRSLPLPPALGRLARAARFGVRAAGYRAQDCAERLLGFR